MRISIINKGFLVYLKNEWNQFFPFIVSAPCKELYLGKNESFISEDQNVLATIIKQISQINFINLTALYLGKFMIKTGRN